MTLFGFRSIQNPNKQKYNFSFLVSLTRTWAKTIAQKLIKKKLRFKFDRKTTTVVTDRIIRVICKLANDLRDQYCDSLTGKDDKEKNKDNDKREKEKEDQKKDDHDK